jgi:isochorismate synthase
MNTLAPPKLESRPREGGLRGALAVVLDAARSRTVATLASAVVPVARQDLVALYGAAESAGLDRALLLQPSQRFGLLGLGSAWSVEAGGRDRFATVEAAWSDLVEAAVLPGDPVPRGAGPLLIGGFGFSDDVATTPLWQDLKAARLVLPEILVTTTPGGTWLTASRVVEADADDRLADEVVARWEALVAAARTGASDGRAPGRLRAVASRPDLASWRDSVARLAGAVGRGRLDKAVLVRQVDLEAEGPIDMTLSLRRLEASAPESTIFAVAGTSMTFLGASPERLVSRRGRDVRTVAMAGTTRRDPDPAGDARLADELLADDKEREEHAVVVEMIRETLAPLSERLEVAPRPSVVRLRHLQHLVTPISARLREPVSIIRLAERLHPTPAVAGAPRDLALELIADEEPGERGWFAGPLGWIDRHGDGELIVALRSGVVAGRRVTLLAGCGIVADSVPDDEWLESEAKLQALGSALGDVEGLLGTGPGALGS